MDALSNLSLNTILHQPVRTRIVAYLSTRGEATFNDLKKTLEITDGNLDSHLKKLSSVKYIQSKKKASLKGKQQTVYKLTKIGSNEFENYVESLKRLLSLQF